MSALQTSLQRVFIESLETILRPIVRFTLHCGLGHSEFAAALKRVFIDVATREYGVRGRPANIAKIAAKTGLPRKAIRRHRSRAARPNWTPDEETSPLNSIIHYWRFDERFCIEPGRPRALAFDGVNSFSALAKMCVGDIPPTALRQELLREGIATLGDGEIQLRKDFSFPDKLNEDFLRNAAFSIARHIETIVHNAVLIDTTEDGEEVSHVTAGRFERLVWSRRLCENSAADLQHWVRSRGNDFVLEADAYISELESQSRQATTEFVSGVGVYFFLED